MSELGDALRRHATPGGEEVPAPVLAAATDASPRSRTGTRRPRWLRGPAAIIAGLVLAVPAGYAIAESVQGGAGTSEIAAVRKQQAELLSFLQERGVDDPRSLMRAVMRRSNGSPVGIDPRSCPGVVGTYRDAGVKAPTILAGKCPDREEIQRGVKRLRELERRADRLRNGRPGAAPSGAAG